MIWRPMTTRRRRRSKPLLPLEWFAEALFCSMARSPTPRLEMEEMVVLLSSSRFRCRRMPKVSSRLNKRHSNPSPRPRWEGETKAEALALYST